MIEPSPMPPPTPESLAPEPAPPSRVLRIALVDPLIPANTGNIGRLCLAVGAELIIVGQPAFDLSEKAVRRAGVDHWQDVRLLRVPTLAGLLAGRAREGVFLFDSAGGTELWDVAFPPSPLLVFGNENPGLSSEVMTEWADRLIRIPMPGWPISAVTELVKTSGVNPDTVPGADSSAMRRGAITARSLNLSNAVAVVAYEVLRQRRLQR